MRVLEAEDGALLECGAIYLAPPDRHMFVERRRIRLTTSELVHFVRPSVDLMFEFVAASQSLKIEQPSPTFQPAVPSGRLFACY